MKRNKISSKLLQENERMERRLQVLKEIMSAEKTRREMGGGIHWDSGQPGLSHIPSHHPPPPTTDLFTAPFNKATSKRHIKVKFLNEKPGNKSEDKSPLRCGQCVKTTASLVCVECKENYCQVCYAKMHHKGAMAQHHVRPILNKFRPLPPADNRAPHNETSSKENNTFDENSDVTTCETETERGVAGTGKGGTGIDRALAGLERGGTLLDGTYDEQGSAQLFQDAVREWRNGRNSSASESKEPPVGSPRNVSTMSDGMQAGEGMITERKDVALKFPETPRMSYFERLILQRCRESPGTNPFLNSSNKGSKQRQSVPVEAEDRGGHSLQGDSETPVVSEYNLFYNNDDEDDIYLNATQEDSLMDFTTEPQMTIKEVQTINLPPITEESVAVPEAKPKLEAARVTAADCKVKVGAKPATHTKLKVKSKAPAKPVSRKTKRPRSENKNKIIKSKKVQDIQNDKEESKIASEATQQLNEWELAHSVKLAWQKCADKDCRKPTLGAFFLHCVSNNNDDVDHSVKPANLHSASLNGVFKLGAQIWRPSSSITIRGKSNSVAAGRLGTPTERSGARSGFTDPYYDSESSDSEPENEREEFICSRLGNVRESTELAFRASRPGTATLYGREEDEEEEMERDQADCDAIESLASELLASTAGFERAMSLSRMHEVEGEEEEEGEVEKEDVEGMCEEMAEMGVASLEDDDLGMSKIQSDFDLFQRNLIDQDSD